MTNKNLYDKDKTRCSEKEQMEEKNKEMSVNVGVMLCQIKQKYVKFADIW
jgi:hypothetical protein